MERKSLACVSYNNKRKLFHSPSPSSENAFKFRPTLTAESLEVVDLKDAVGISTDSLENGISYTSEICSEGMLKDQVKGEKSMRVICL